MILLYQKPRFWQYTKKVLSCHDGVLKFTVAILGRIGYTLSIKSRKRENMTEFESKCYGMSEADIREQYMESITARHCGLEMVVMGILSDAQEMVAVGYSENVRLYLNRAKYILSEMMEEKSSQVA
jgi:hypothetical protein